MVVGGQPGHARTRGTWVCGSVWTCPQCAAGIQAARREALAEAARLLGDCAMVTLTLRHHKGEGLPAVRDRVRVAWRRATSGRNGWRGDYAKVFEVTEGAGGGFHPHLHVLVRSADAEALVSAWLGNADSDREAQDITVIDSPAAAAEYLAAELLGSSTKSRSQWAVLQRAVDGDELAIAMWAHIESAMKGVRQITWSRNLGRMLREVVPDLDTSDSDLADRAENQPNTAVELVALRISPEGWDRLTRVRACADLMQATALWDWGAMLLIVDRWIPGLYDLPAWVKMALDNRAARYATPTLF